MHPSLPPALPLINTQSFAHPLRSSLGAVTILATISLGGALAKDPPPPVEKHIRLLQVTDLDAELETHLEYTPGEQPELQQMGGFARLKTVVERERATAPGGVFFINSGNTFFGSGPATWTKGQVALGPLNALGLDLFVPGYWDFAYGPARFRELMVQVGAPVVCFNLNDAATGERLFIPSITLLRKGARVAFIGLTDWSTTLLQAPPAVQGLDSTRIGGIRQMAQALKREADVVVAVTAAGLPVSRHLARLVPELDVVLSGGSDERTAKPIVEGKTLLVESGSMGSFLGRLDLTVRDGKIAETAFALVPVRAADCNEAAAEKALVETALTPQRARMNQPAGQTEKPIMRYDLLETNADDLISDAIRETATADIGLADGFRFGPPIAAGKFTENDSWALLPADGHIKMGWMTGKELKEYIEAELERVYSTNPISLSGPPGPRASGLTMTFAARAAAGHRLRTLQVAGKEVVDETHYTFAGPEREGEPQDVICRHRGTHDVKMLAMIHDALTQYFKKHPSVAPGIDERFLAVDLPKRVFSQDTVVSATVAPAEEIAKTDPFQKPPNTPTLPPK